MRRRTSRRAALAAIAVLATGACRSERSPVAALEAQPQTVRLPFPEYAEVEIALEPSAPLPEGAGEPLVFLHLLDEPGSVLRTFDHAFPGPWTVGRETRYRVKVHQSAFAEPLDPGTYTLTAGLYDRDLGRYALATRGEEVARLEYRVGQVVVPALDERTPHARFSENWLPAEPGADRQILARRTLRAGGPGTIQIGPLVGPGRLHLALEIPPGGADVRLELDDGESEPKVRVASSCGGEQAELSGAGGHDLELAVPEAITPWICDLTIVPNFRRLSGENVEATSVRLAILAWRPVSPEEP
jgi:hypothetical protein